MVPSIFNDAFKLTFKDSISGRNMLKAIIDAVFYSIKFRSALASDTSNLLSWSYKLRIANKSYMQTILRSSTCEDVSSISPNNLLLCHSFLTIYRDSKLKRAY